MQIQARQLTRDSFGRLVFTGDDGQVQVGVVPVRAFPITAPQQGVALVGTDGKELVWISDLSAEAADVRHMIEEELNSREFMPEIRRIMSVSTYATPSTWEIETDRGATQLTLKGEEDIRRLAGGVLLIADHHGIQYLIRDSKALDKVSRKILDRFL